MCLSKYYAFDYAIMQDILVSVMIYKHLWYLSLNNCTSLIIRGHILVQMTLLIPCW